MADISGSVIGVTLAKINGKYEVDVKNSRWSGKVNVPQAHTGGGIRNARGLEAPSGSFEAVIPRDKAFDYRALRQFSVEIYDIETRSKVVAAFAGCDWTGIDGSSDVQSAVTSKSIAWVGTEVIKI